MTLRSKRRNCHQHLISKHLSPTHLVAVPLSPPPALRLRPVHPLDTMASRPALPAFLPSAPLPAYPLAQPLPLSSPPYRPPLRTCVPSTPKRHRSLLNATAPVSVTGVSQTPDTATQPNLNPILDPRYSRRFIFFGGKGGVGKTSASAAAAVRSADAGFNTLVISTDPAHSLGDALRTDLSDGNLHRIDDTIPLYAIESDTKEAVEEFRNLVASLNAPPTADTNESGWASVASKLGLQEFSDVLETIPPGADELIALVSVLDLVQASNPDVYFERIIIDTAPTGHTLRLLAFPDFLDKFLTQALALRKQLDKAGGMIANVAKIFSGGSRLNVNHALEKAAERVEHYRDKCIALSDLFRDPERTEFVVVTIATVLAVEESKRLIDRLWDEGIWVRHAVVNQVLPPGSEETIANYLTRVRKGQAREISFATECIADEYGLSISLVPRFDTEVRGVYGLDALGNVAFKKSRQKSYGLLFDEDATVANGQESQFVLVGGKGGVGKTSISAALGVRLASQGFKTLVLSTDPAHSLADALQISLEGGTPLPIELPQGELYAMEIDTERAIAEFQKLAKEFVAEGRRGAGVDLARKLGLEEFASLLDNAPPGIDELVALTQVLELVKFGDFDRVVIDTAPTGHTLRLLSFPEFLDTFLGKVIRLKQRLDSALDTLRNVLGRKDSADAVDNAARGIGKLRENMEELRKLVANKERTQFAVVTVPTGLAMAESERLVRSLRKDEVEINNLIINQIIPDSSAQAFVDRIIAKQDQCIGDMRKAGEDKNISLVEVPYFDVEVRGVYGLRAMAGCMFSDEIGE